VSYPFRSQVGSEREIGCELHPETSSHTRTAGLLTSNAEGKTTSRDILFSHPMLRTVF
jgi:hypothetical protein